MEIHFRRCRLPALPSLVLVSSVVMAATGVREPPAPVRWTVEKASGPGTSAGYPEITGVDHFELMRVTPETGTFCHHSHILHDGDRFYATWSNHLADEDSPGQRVLFAMSTDGRKWTEPKDCFPPLGPRAERGIDSRVLTANGLHRIGGVVYAIAGANDVFRDRGAVMLGNLAREIRPGGALGPMFWLTRDGPGSFPGFPFDIPGSADTRFSAPAAQLLAFRYQPENIPSWSFFPGGRHGDDYTVATGYWKSFGGTMRADDGALMCEPTAYRRPDGVAVRLFRDRNGKSRRIYAAVYDDASRIWTVPQRTNIPDAGSRAVAGRLPNGGVYLVGNQTWGAMESKSSSRDPLVLSVSRDGIVLDQAWIIRAGCPARRYAGKAKIPGFQYPHATVVGDELWVIYSINKEDVAVTRVPLKQVLAAMAAARR